ncbi:RICIN domain-containing protein [Streptomyces sp. NPDC002994]|uniref:RICIN domain-containing protein n=1 Tax=Streptomyces sp. NPDC002994 TaxID=3154441 RepID=UPI0033A92E63
MRGGASFRGTGGGTDPARPTGSCPAAGPGPHSCNSGSYQKWTVARVSGGYTVKNMATGRCLDSNANQAVYTRACNGGSYQKWAISTGYKLKNVATGFYLDSNHDKKLYTGAGNSGNYYPPRSSRLPHGLPRGGAQAPLLTCALAPHLTSSGGALRCFRACARADVSPAVRAACRGTSLAASSAAFRATSACASSRRAAGLGIPPSGRRVLEASPSDHQQRRARFALVATWRGLTGAPLRRSVGGSSSPRL